MQNLKDPEGTVEVGKQSFDTRAMRNAHQEAITDVFSGKYILSTMQEVYFPQHMSLLHDAVQLLASSFLFRWADIWRDLAKRGYQSPVYYDAQPIILQKRTTEVTKVFCS